MNKSLAVFFFSTTLFIACITKVFSQDQPESKKPITISSAFYEFPIAYLTQINEYIAQKRKDSPRIKITDDRDFRSNFIKEKDPYRGYYLLQTPGGKSHTRMQVFVPKMDMTKGFLALETTDCLPSCRSKFELYKKDSSGWVIAPENTLPQYDNKYLAKKVKEKYVKEYTDADLFINYGYDNESTLLDALELTISPDAASILVREPKLGLNVYEIIWDAEKAAFTLKKLL